MVICLALNSDAEHSEDGKDADGKHGDEDRGLESAHEMPRCKHCGRPFKTEKRMVEHKLKCSKKAKAMGGPLIKNYAVKGLHIDTLFLSPLDGSRCHRIQR